MSPSSLALFEPPAGRSRRDAAPAFARSGLGDLAILLAVSAGLCAIFFCGFGLGDDVAYDDLANQILHVGYPTARGTLVFAGRPVLLLLIAASYRLFGQNELTFVLPTIVSALVCVAAVYGCAREFGGRRAAIVAAVLLMLSTLHVSYQTSLANDIVGAAFLGAAAYLACVAPRTGRRIAPAFALVAGFVAAMSWGVKSSFALLSMPVFAALIAHLVVRRRVTLVVPLVGGIALGAAALAIFFQATAGDPLAAFRVELTFNRTYMLAEAGRRPAGEMLLFYPRLLTEGMFGGSPSRQSVGWLLPIAVAAWAAALARRRPAAALIGAVMCVMFLSLELWPLQLSPYVPIHRLPRFLYPVMLPAAVLAGLAASEWAGRSRRGVAALAIACCAYGWVSLTAAARTTGLHTDAMSDVRFAAALALNASGPVVADDELIEYINVRARAEHRTPVLMRLSPHVAPPAGSLVIVGGSRRPELDPAYALAVAPASVPPDWVPLVSLPGEPGPARRMRGVVYMTTVEPAGREAIMAGRCPAGRDWIVRDVVEIGDAASEAAHTYRVERATWRGGRMLREGTEDAWDRGIAFAGSQSFLVRDLVPAQDLCVAKRIDGRVSGQVSRIETSTSAPAPMQVRPSRDGEWGTAVAVVPAAAVRLSEMELREAFVSSTVDVNAFRIEIYQAAPDRGTSARK